MKNNRNIEILVLKAKSDPQILAIYLFGSYLEGKRYQDIDIVLVLNDNLSELDMAKKRLSYQSDVPKIFDIQVLQLLPAHIQLNVLKGKLLYCQDYETMFDIAIEVIRNGESMRRKIQLMVSP